MKTYKPLSPKSHAIMDYALAGGLLVLPALLRLNRRARFIYAAEAAILLPYIALTKTPVAIKGLIPLTLHRRIDTINVAQFALQSLLPAIRPRKEKMFNIGFTTLAALTVLLTDWKRD